MGDQPGRIAQPHRQVRRQGGHHGPHLRPALQPGLDPAREVPYVPLPEQQPRIDPPQLREHLEREPPPPGVIRLLGRGEPPGGHGIRTAPGRSLHLYVGCRIGLHRHGGLRGSGDRRCLRGGSL
ncbi:hypothetical protein ACIQV3_38930 [Streptomyces sp. NPDC099050]|uniref:hypothetical protein n=1 Tax=Streptomyces sp. NPDC099050 TaxID=3366100 RepID=UPI00383062DF